MIFWTIFDKKLQSTCSFHVNVIAPVPLKLAGFSGGSLQASVKPQAAAIPAAVPTMHRY